MKALIIAAGSGSRLGSLTINKPKALIQLLGISLIERVILTAWIQLVRPHKNIHKSDFLVSCNSIINHTHNYGSKQNYEQY